MSDIINVSRRAFLKTIGISGGGLILGTTLPNILPVWAQTPVNTKHELNLFVQISNDNQVYIVAHRSEMGQGIRTGLPQVLADELEADWNKVSIIQGSGDKKYGRQNTDGSRSIRNFYQKMREAGAAAKAMLTQAAAQKWAVPVDQCTAINHQVLHKASGQSFTYGELAELAASLNVPASNTLKLKKTTEFKYIGKPIPIVDMDAIVTGKTQFGIDVYLDDMIYASIERCPVIGGSVKSFDASACKKSPSIIDVIKISGTPLPAEYHPIESIAVIADNTWAAMQGRKKLSITWNLGDNQKHQSDQYLEEIRKRVQTPGETILNRGNVDAAMKQYSDQHHATYTTPYLVHASMEPPAATAVWRNGVCEIWSCCQTPQRVQETVARALSIDSNNVIVNVTLLGGGFGRKSKSDFSIEAAILAKRLNRPVKVTWSREDDIRSGYYHAIAALHFSVALNKKGNVKAWIQRTAYPSISSTFTLAAKAPSDSELSLGFGNIPYDIEHLRCERHEASAHIRIGWLRSVCNIHQAFAINSFVDEIAHKTKRNTHDLLLTLIGPDRSINPVNDGFKYSNHGASLSEYPFNTARLKNVIKLAAKKSGYGRKLPKDEGWGIAAHRSFLSYVAVVTRVKLHKNNLQIIEMFTCVDCGLAVNPDRVTSQMEGAMIFGLSLALMGEISIKDGAVIQSNFHDYPILRINQCPSLEVHIVNSNENPAGVGEPGVPPVAPSITSAIAAAGGKRIRDLPINQHYSV